MPNAKRIAEFLLDIGAVKLSVEEPFTWTSGLKSPIYCDNRMIYSHPEARTVVTQSLAERIRNIHIEPDVIAGTATAAIGWGALVADKLDMPFVYVRSKPKAHGMARRIEGDLSEEKHVLVVEDLISTGGSSISTVEALRDEGKAVVTDVVSIFTYDFAQATERAAQTQLHLHPLSNIATLLEVAKEQGRISDDEAQEVTRFIKDPKAWRA